MKQWISLLLVFLLIMGLTACGEKNGDHVINFQGQSVPQNIDPLLASTASERMIMENVFESLFIMDQTGQITPGCASGYQTNGQTCTVTLQPDLKWADGTPITPHDFIFALQRAVSPETKAACGGQLTGIQGAAEILQGKQPATTLGVTAAGNTLVFSLVGKAEVLLAALAGPAGVPCNKAFFENCKGRYGTGRVHVLTNGAFQIKGWSNEEPDIFLRLIRNEQYRAAETVRPAGVYFTFGTEKDGYALLGEGKVDGTAITGDMVETATQEGYTLLAHHNQTYGLLMNTKGRAEMKNADLRKALMGVIDQKTLSEYLPSSCEGATGVVMPNSFYATKPYPSTNGYILDLKANAKACFQNAVNQLGAEALTDLQLWYVETPDTRSAIDYMVQCWQKEFGLYVTVKSVSQSELWYGLENGYCHMGVGKLSAQGNSSLELLENFAFVGENTTNGFTDKAYDQLLKTAKESGEISHQQQCEAHLFNQGYLLPLYVTKNFYAFDSSVSQIYLDASAQVLQLEKADKE